MALTKAEVAESEEILITSCEVVSSSSVRWVTPNTNAPPLLPIAWASVAYAAMYADASVAKLGMLPSAESKPMAPRRSPEEVDSSCRRNVIPSWPSSSSYGSNNSVLTESLLFESFFSSFSARGTDPLGAFASSRLPAS